MIRREQMQATSSSPAGTSGPLYDIRTLPSPDIRAFLILLILALATWQKDFSFFWMDEWFFLSALRQPSLEYLLEDHNGHLIPLYKLVFHGQLLLFGTNTGAYALLNLVFFAFVNLAVFRLVRDLSSEPVAWVVAILLTIHPMEYSHVLWNFQQSVTLHILFQVLAVHAFLRWTRDRRPGRLVLAFACTVVQQYMFGNGLFIPLLLAFGVLLFTAERIAWRAFLAAMVLFAALVVLQLALGGDRTDGALSGFSFLGAAGAIMHMAALNGARFFFVQDGILGPATHALGFLALAACIAAMLVRRDQDRRVGWLIVAWFMADLVTIPLALGEQVVLRDHFYYYSTLCVVPMALIVSLALQRRAFWRRIPARPLQISIAIAAVGIFLFDREMAGTHSFRNFRNQQMMFRSIEQGSVYQGFDDASFHGANTMQDAAATYQYWRDKDHFRPPFGFASEPTNWTRDTSLYIEK